MFYVDGIVTVVDPINLERHLESSDECYKQIAFADLFILNKTDIAEENQLKQTQSLISHINPITKTIKAIRCEVNPKNILNLGAKTHTAKLLNCEDSNKAHEHHDNHQHGHEHNSPVHSISIQMDGEMDQAQLRYWISTLIFDRSDVIYRMKGIINVKGRDDKLVFQSVHRLFEDHLGGPWKANEKRNNRIVFIGEKLDKAELEEGLKSCLAH
jgi:G3E family GTPase